MWVEPEHYRLRHANPTFYYALLPHAVDVDVYTNVARVRRESTGALATAILPPTFVHADAFDVIAIVGFNALEDRV
jgi:hypothetical protein